MRDLPDNGPPVSPGAPQDDHPGLEFRPAPQAHRFCDACSEGLIYFMVVFCPWAFGTTQPWAIWTMNVTGYLLGGLLAAKQLIRWKTGYRPHRWGAGGPQESGAGEARGRWWTRLLVVMTVLLLGWCLVSAVNARANYVPARRAFDYFKCLEWLPHSYDRSSTWFLFWQYVGLACYFWGLRDWLLTKSRLEQRHEIHGSGRQRRPSNQAPHRLRRLLWLLGLNAAVLALVAILHKMQGSDKLLWILKSSTASKDAHFGPFNYRSNAAQYLNLAWPVCLGFWWILCHRHRGDGGFASRFGGGAHILLVPCVVITAAAPLVSNSRGGAITAVGLAGIAALCLLFAPPRRHLGSKLALLGAFLTILALGVFLGWGQLSKRLYRYAECVEVDRALGSADFTMRVQLQCRGTNVARTLPLAALSDSPKQAWGRAGSFLTCLVPGGHLAVYHLGDEADRFERKVYVNFLREATNSEVDVVVVRHTNVTVYLNGRSIPGVQDAKGAPMQWTDSVFSSQFWVGGFSPLDANLIHPVREATLFNYALTAEEIRAWADGTQGVTAAATSDGPYLSDFANGSDGFYVETKDIQLEPVSEWLAGVEHFWLRLSRRSQPGPMFASRSLTDMPLHPDQKLRLEITLRNPNKEPIRVGLSRGRTMIAIIRLPPAADRTARYTFDSGSEASQPLALGLVDDQGQWQKDVPADVSLLVRSVRVDPLGVAAHVRLPDKPVVRFDKRDWTGRDIIYRNAKQMASEYPWLGSGPGSFMNLSQLYREEAAGKWPAYVHDDWLETRITFGWIGSGLILGAGLMALVGGAASRWGMPWEFRCLLLLALAGCLAQAKMDFPFQIYSIFHLFMTGLCIWFCFGGRASVKS